MNQLEQTITTVEIAEMMEISHKEILRKIEGANDRKGYSPILTENHLVPSDYFILSSYKDGSGKENKCYEVTKLGCDFLANKFTGEKGIIFTAKYVKRFHDMEDTIKDQIIDYSNLSPELQMFKQIFDSVARSQLELQQMKESNTRIEQKVESIREVVALDTTSWREDTGNILRKIGVSLGGGQAYSQARTESYELLNKRMGVDLQTRFTNKRRRMADNGVCKSARDKLSFVDVIAEDKKLIEGYTAIVKEMAIKYGVA